MVITLWWTYKKQLKMAIEIVDFPIENGDFPWQNVSSPEGMNYGSNYDYTRTKRKCSKPSSVLAAKCIEESGISGADSVASNFCAASSLSKEWICKCPRINLRWPPLIGRLCKSRWQREIQNSRFFLQSGDHWKEGGTLSSNPLKRS